MFLFSAAKVMQINEIGQPKRENIFQLSAKMRKKLIFWLRRTSFPRLQLHSIVGWQDDWCLNGATR